MAIDFTPTNLYLFDRFGKNLGIVRVITAEHDEDLDGTDELVITTFDKLEKGDYIVWRDSSPEWHEHMVDEVDRVHADGASVTQAKCINSINETYRTLITQLPNGQSGTSLDTDPATWLADVLNEANCRWYAGDIDLGDYGTAGALQPIEIVGKSVREIIAAICETYDLELQTRVGVSQTIDDPTDRVRHRFFDLIPERATDDPPRRFTYGRNVSRVMRRIASDEIYTKIEAYGGTISEADFIEQQNPTVIIYFPTSDNKNNWHLYSDCEEIVGSDIGELPYATAKNASGFTLCPTCSKRYFDENANDSNARIHATVYDDDAKALYGVEGRDATIQHSVGIFVDNNITDAGYLEVKAQQFLNDKKQPKISYEADFEILSTETSATWNDIRCGSIVDVVDDDFDGQTPVRIRSRCTHIHRDLTGVTQGTVQIGNFRNALTSTIEELSSGIASSTPATSGGDTPTPTPEPATESEFDHLFPVYRDKTAQKSKVTIDSISDTEWGTYCSNELFISEMCDATYDTAHLRMRNRAFLEVSDRNHTLKIASPNAPFSGYQSSAGPYAILNLSTGAASLLVSGVGSGQTGGLSFDSGTYSLGPIATNSSGDGIKISANHDSEEVLIRAHAGDVLINVGAYNGDITMQAPDTASVSIRGGGGGIQFVGGKIYLCGSDSYGDLGWHEFDPKAIEDAIANI